ncbi:MAG TPA: hypothetical protein VKA05_06860, partial [Acidimicrobiales bacterium]|nr:hypothetical protein [Acidimicrobiales bacterium]
MNPPDLTPPLDRDALLGRTMQRAAVLAIARRRRRRVAQVGSAMALVLVLTSTSLTVLALRSNRHTAIVPGGTSTTTTSTVASPVGPKGWVPVDYGDLQISVPPTWTFVDPEECAGGRKDTVYENIEFGVHCPAEHAGPGPSVALYAKPVVDTLPTSERTINGIVVFDMAPGRYEADDVVIQLTGSGAAAILRTLTYSPRYVALLPGKAPPVPKSWSWMTEPGWRIAVPAAWLAAGRHFGPFKVEGPGCDGPFHVLWRTGPFAAIDTDSIYGWAEKCLALPPPTSPPKPVDGLIINVKPSGSWPGGTPVCSRINHVAACIVDGIPDTDILYVWVHAPGQTMLLEIGLAGTGMAARTVLDSLRAFPC